MTEKIKQLIEKYRELIVYIICGVITTAADYISYAILTRLLDMGETPAQTIACAVAIIVAFVLNKWIVFKDSGKGETLIKQFVSFASMRVISALFQIFALWLFSEKLGLYDMAVKLVTSVVVVISNYVFSKLMIFKKKGSDTK